MKRKCWQEPYGRTKSETGGKYEETLFSVNEKQWILKRVNS